MNSRVVLVSRLRSSLGVSGDHDGLTVADVRHPDAVETTLASVHRGGDVPFVICGTTDFEDVRTLLTQARVRYPGLGGFVEPLPGGPMAVGVLSSLVDDLASEPDGLAWQLHAVDYLRAHTWSATWLPSVAGLRDPNPRLTQHIASWFTKGFMVEHHPNPRVSRAAKTPFDGLPTHVEHALLHSPTQDSWVVDAVHSALGTQSKSEVSPVRESIDAHGSERAVEFVAVPLSYHDDSRPDPQSVLQCRGCGLSHARASCPQCGMDAAAIVEPPRPSGDEHEARASAPALISSEGDIA